MRQLKQRVIASYHLGPLDRPDTQSYVEHRLRHVGWNDDPHFSTDAYERIFRATAGVPRRINTLCDRLLLAGYLADRHEIDVDDVSAVSAEMVAELGGHDGPVGTLTEIRRLNGAQRHDPVALHSHDPGLPTGSYRRVEAPAADRLDRIEERVALLESSHGMMFNLLRRILRSLRPGEDNRPESLG
jgi:hypothetical protein